MTDEPMEGVRPFDRLPPRMQAEAIDHVRDVGEGPCDKSTTEHEARQFLRAMEEEDLLRWIESKERGAVLRDIPELEDLVHKLLDDQHRAVQHCIAMVNTVAPNKMAAGAAHVSAAASLVLSAVDALAQAITATYGGEVVDFPQAVLFAMLNTGQTRVAQVLVQAREGAELLARSGYALMTRAAATTDLNNLSRQETRDV
jgi:acetolactate synthase small subunit